MYNEWAVHWEYMWAAVSEVMVVAGECCQDWHLSTVSFLEEDVTLHENEQCMAQHFPPLPIELLPRTRPHDCTGVGMGVGSCHAETTFKAMTLFGTITTCRMNGKQHTVAPNRHAQGAYVHTYVHTSPYLALLMYVIQASSNTQKRIAVICYTESVLLDHPMERRGRWMGGSGGWWMGGSVQHQLE